MAGVARRREVAHSGRDGRFSFSAVRDGSHRCRVQAADGSEGESELRVPPPSRKLRVSLRAGHSLALTG